MERGFVSTYSSSLNFPSLRPPHNGPVPISHIYGGALNCDVTIIYHPLPYRETMRRETRDTMFIETL